MKPRRRDALPQAVTLLMVAGIAFVLNWIWENTQLPLYGGHPHTGHETLPRFILLRATVTDAVLITGVMLLALVVRRWLSTAFWLVLLATLAVIAAGIEIRAITAGRWSYSDAMPTIGVVGLSPLLQLPVTAAVTALLVRPWRSIRASG